MSAREGRGRFARFHTRSEISYGPSKAKFRVAISTCIVVFFCLWAIAARASTETKTFIAFSMRAAEAKIKTAIKDSVDFRRRQLELYQLGGITKPWAIINDPEHGDWILSESATSTRRL